MRIAFFGGSFDPPHLGHIAIAQAAQQALHLDKILFAPVGLQPLKPLGSSASFEDRAAMTQLAIADHSDFSLSLADAPQPGDSKPNYTIETLLSLRQQSPSQTELYLLLGADSFRTLHHWHRAAEVPFAANLILASRPNEDISDIPSLLPAGIHSTAQSPTHYILSNAAGQQANLSILPNLHYEVSATNLRNQIQDPSPQIPSLLNPAVLNYIHQHRLYQ